jgi:6-phosphofructokinase 1
LTIIPEEFRHKPIRLKTLVDILVAAFIKRLAAGRSDGVAVLAEGLVEFLDQQDLNGLEDVERDQHGHVRLAEVNFGVLLKRAVEKELRTFGVKTTIVEKNIGYELRCADPISFDMEYTRDLGYCAAQFLLDGGTAAMVSIQNGRFIPIPFGDILDPATGRTRVRMVDIESESYTIARRYMIRLSPEDLSQPQEVVRLATAAGLASDDFRTRFEYLMGKDV